MAVVQRFLQRRLVDQATARAVDDPHALLGLGEVFLAEDVAGLVGQRRMQRDEVGAGEQRIEVCLLHAHFDRAFWRQERIEGHDLHLEAERAGSDDAADIARADQAQRLAGDFDAHEVILRPFARLRLGVGFGDLAREREHQRNGVFRRGDRVAERRVHHHHALGGA
jgi:hypothetical protein